MDSATLFRNRIVYDNYHLPFVDRYSQFGVTFEPGGAVGPGMVQVRSAAVTFQVTCSTLALWTVAQGTLVRVQRTALTCLPWCVTEEAALDDTGQITVTARHAFIDERRMVSKFTFVNRTPAQYECSPVWLGQFTGDRFGTDRDSAEYGYAEPFARRQTWAVGQTRRVTGGLRNTKDEVLLPQPSLRVSAAADLRVHTGELPLWACDRAGTVDRELTSDSGAIFYWFNPGLVRIAAGKSKSFRFELELSVGSYRAQAPGWASAIDARDMDAIVAEAQVDFERRVALNTPPSAPRELAPALWRSRWALLRTGYRNREDAGEYRDLIASTCVPSCSGFTRVFFWDSLFTATALAEFEPEFAKGAIEAAFSRQDPRGHCPEHSFNYHVPARNVIGAPQAPVATHAVSRYLAKNPADTAFAQRMFPVLARNHAYWVNEGDRDGDGLAEWTWSGQTADDSPLFDEYLKNGGCGWLPPVASVQLNSFLYRDALELAALAEILGKSTEAESYRSGAQARAEALMRVCYVPAERRFWDFNHATGRHRRVKTFYMFWPIWAGMPLEPSVKKELIESVLLDEKQFFGPIPFPSVAVDEPSYDPKGYWRGRAWPHISYWLLEMLAREGYAGKADEAASRIIAAYLREPTFAENLATDPGLWGAGGQPDYNWGAAAFYLIGTKAYRPATNK